MVIISIRGEVSVVNELQGGLIFVLDFLEVCFCILNFDDDIF